MTITEIYSRTCESYSKLANESQLEAWNSVLSRFAPVEVKRAVDDWRQDTSEDDMGQPRGRWMPSPTELLAIIEHGRRQSKAAEKRFESCGKCDEGWIRIFSGLTFGTVVSGNNPDSRKVDPKMGAVRRCDCWWNYLASYYGVSRADLPAKLKEVEKARRRAR